MYNYELTLKLWTRMSDNANIYNVHMFVVSNVRLVSIYFYCSSVSSVRTVSNV